MCENTYLTHITHGVEVVLVGDSWKEEEMLILGHYEVVFGWAVKWRGGGEGGR